MQVACELGNGTECSFGGKKDSKNVNYIFNTVKI